MELKPGDKLGRYQLLSPIGEGGMGEVWKARDTQRPAGSCPDYVKRAAQIEWHEMGTHMPTEFFEKHPTLLRLEMFTVMNEGFKRWDPVPKSAEAKAFLVITAENLGDGAFTTQIVGLSLNGLKDMGKNGIQHVAEPAEKQRAIVNGCLENASRAIVNRLAGKYDPFMRTKGPVQ